MEMAGVTDEMAATATFYRGKGCSRCNGTGYRGRMGIFELMIMSPKVREMTFRQAAVADIRRIAIQEGMKTLYMDGLQKVLKGKTTLEELLSVARPEEELR